MEDHSSRLEQAEDRISELEDKMKIKGKTEELLVKQLKTCERNMQELTNSIKRPHLRNMSIEEGEKVQAKQIHNIFNEIITENIPNLEKNRTSPQHITIKNQAQNIKNIEGCKREKTNSIQR
jgi:chromosome segregation ATPase